MFFDLPKFPSRLILLCIVLVPACSATRTPAVAERTRVYATAEPVVRAEAIGPLTKATPLQVVSMFSYEPGEQLVSPATEIAEFVADARVNRGYGKQALQPLFVTPTPSTIKATRLLVIAWGPRSEFSIEQAKSVGHTAMRETLRLGVGDMAYAPIARDQGVTTISAADVAAAFVEGAMREFLAQRATAAPGSLKLRLVTYEAGPSFVDAVSDATARGVDAAHTMTNSN